jgi:hypothetical protein
LLLVAKMEVGLTSLLRNIYFYKISTAFDVFADLLDETFSVSFSSVFRIG